MFIKKTKKTVKGKTYVNHLLVESVVTPKGPRHRVICSLGSLAPAPREQWLSLAHKIEQALGGQQSLLPDERVEEIVAQVRTQAASHQDEPSGQTPGAVPAAAPTAEATDLVAVHTHAVRLEQAREAGAVHVGHRMWDKLGLDAILAQAGLNERAQLLTQVMTLSRLVFPRSEHAMPDWIRRTALEDILDTDFSRLDDNALYRHLDRLHPQRGFIEQHLAQRERSLFDLDDSLYIYDITSTYFEGQCLGNPQAQRGYSRDQRPDCKQVLVGLVVDADGFPKAHEVFDGNRTDRTTVEEMLSLLEQRSGRRQGATVIVDRGMAFDRQRGGRQGPQPPLRRRLSASGARRPPGRV